MSGSLLPDAFPEGDPSDYALPVYLEEPSDSFVARGRPAKLKCRVAHALRVYFTCNDEEMPNTTSDDVVEPETGIRYTRVSLEVKRNQVLDVIGTFACKCHAASSKGEVASAEAIIRTACKSEKSNFGAKGRGRKKLSPKGKNISVCKCQ